jgi:hypothetical protein
MNKNLRNWLVWFIATVIVVTSGFLRGWTRFEKVMLIAVGVLGVLQILLPAMQSQMHRKLKGMTPEEREKFLARFDQKTQAMLRKRLEADDA